MKMKDHKIEVLREKLIKQIKKAKDANEIFCACDICQFVFYHKIIHNEN